MDSWQPATDGARWLWPASLGRGVNQYVAWQHGFRQDKNSAHAICRISVDTDYALSVNGRFVARGQFPDYPDAKTFDQLDITPFLNDDDNVLSILTWYNGQTSSVYLTGMPGLVFAVTAGKKILCASGDGTQWRPSAAYHSGTIARVSPQLAFTFGYDARRPEAAWQAIAEADAPDMDHRHTLAPRPIAKLQDGGMTSARMVAQGHFSYDLEYAAEAHGAPIAGVHDDPGGYPMADGALFGIAWMMQYAHFRYRPDDAVLRTPERKTLPDPQGMGIILPSAGRPSSGTYCILDLGEETVGLCELEIDAEAGTVCDIGYGEHLDDLRVRSYVGGRHFAARYVCREGRQRFTHHYLRWAARYLQICIHGTDKPVTLHHLGLLKQDFPVTERGSLHVSDGVWTRRLAICRDTLRACMHDHYEDCPWREQALYANDSRIQALCGYYLFGEYDFPKASLALLGEGKRDDGWLELTAPAKPRRAIPSFTPVWMLAVRDHFLFSSDDSLARRFLPFITATLDRHLATRRDDCIPLDPSDGVWHFYDWTPGLSDYPHDAIGTAITCDSLLNALFIMAMEAACDMAAWTGQPALAASYPPLMETLRGALRRRFWDPERQAFLTHACDDRLSELTQALAILAGVTTPAEARMLARRMTEGAFLRASTSQSYYVFEAILRSDEALAPCVLARIDEVWGGMERAGCTTYWETEDGSSAFAGAGSLCHGWSAVPLAVAYAWMLGVRPVAPGFSRYVIQPAPSIAGACAANVPVPGGHIGVRRTCAGDKRRYTIDSPAGCIPEFLDPQGTVQEGDSELH